MSFSPIASDARVLKQVRGFRDDYDVTTVGYGPAPDGVVKHWEMPRAVDYQDLNGRLITARAYRAVYWRISAVRWVRERLPRDEYDVILANEPEAVGVALWLRPRKGVHADLHEYTPRLNEEHEAWARRIRPYHEWICRRYVTKADSWTTVSNGLVREYEKEFGFRPELVTNAAPYADLAPSPVSGTIRLVHSGACLRNRRLDEMITAVEAASADVTLDLYLTPNHPDYLEELKELGAGSSRVRVLDPVPYAELITTLNAYDVGIHLLPPTNFNNTWALPNKLFDYVQARLGILIGPSPEMQEYIERYGFGAVADGFDAADLTRRIDALSSEAVENYKRRADENALDLGAERQVEIWRSAVEAITRAPGAR
ncbi:glycosyltransferase [Microbacterium hydrocarbonoxydans]|uniref:glycosyltransferase n=1 Tax=Microbacterium hydrocarbonoxydans TaxID=273678 RepID=UPI001FB9CA63|nr:glycosyltransferase [Microbacterium hydrocarbonoxydans]